MASLNGTRNEDGTFMTIAWPGGYPLYYYDNENNVLCATCANKKGMSTKVVEADINWEDVALFCDDCGKQIHSAYGDDEEETEVPTIEEESEEN